MTETMIFVKCHDLVFFQPKYRDFACFTRIFPF